MKTPIVKNGGLIRTRGASHPKPRESTAVLGYISREARGPCVIIFSRGRTSNPQPKMETNEH